MCSQNNRMVAVLYTVDAQHSDINVKVETSDQKVGKFRLI